MMLMLLLMVVAAACIGYYFLVKYFNYWEERGVKRGNPKYKFGDNWGMMLRTQSFTEMVEMIYNQCPGTRYSGVYQLFMPILLVKDSELIKQITVKDYDHFLDHKCFVPDNTDPLFSRNLFALKGQEWRDMRLTLSPAFTSSKMRGMFVLMSECAENFVQYFLNKNESVVTVELKDIFTRYTSDSIASIAFGIKVDSLKEPNNDFYTMGKKATDFSGFKKNFILFMYFFVPKICSIFKIKFFSDEVHTFLKNLVKDIMKTREEKGIVRPDMINLLIEATRSIQKEEVNSAIDTESFTASDKSKLPTEVTDSDIAAQAMVFFLGAFDSVSAIICFLAYELAANPDIQDRLREEIKTTLEQCDGELTYDSLLNMKYMDMVVSETLRKWPTAIITDRLCTKPYTIDPATPDETPLHLEKGTVIWLPIFGIHRDPENYPDPERFDPERFSDENKGNIKPYTYLPFGVGLRNCIGFRFALFQTKTVMFYILKHFELVPVEKSRIPLQLTKKSVAMLAEGGFWFGLKRIDA